MWMPDTVSVAPMSPLTAVLLNSVAVAAVPPELLNVDTRVQPDGVVGGKPDPKLTIASSRMSPTTVLDGNGTEPVVVVPVALVEPVSVGTPPAVPETAVLQRHDEP